MASLFDAFHAGFHKVCGGKVLQLFQPNELQAMVIGNTNYDWKELEKVRENKSMKLSQWKGKRKMWFIDRKIALLFIVFHFTLLVIFIGKYYILPTPQWMNLVVYELDTIFVFVVLVVFLWKNVIYDRGQIEVPAKTEFSFCPIIKPLWKTFTLLNTFVYFFFCLLSMLNFFSRE